MSYIGLPPALQIFKKADFVGDGATTSFNLVDPVSSVNGLLVVVGGVIQEPTSAYTIESTPFAATLEFTSAPSLGVDIYAVWLGSPNADDIDLSTFLRTTDTAIYNRESITLACSDEINDIEVGNGVVSFRMPYAFTLVSVRASVTTAPTGSTIIVDINDGGSSILSTKLSIDATEKTSTTAATPAVISDTSLSDDTEITIDIDQVGSTVPGVGLKVYLIGYRT